MKNKLSGDSLVYSKIDQLLHLISIDISRKREREKNDGNTK